MERLLDSHCHLGFAADPVGLAAELDALGIDAVSMTVTPEAFERERALLAGCSNVRVALGLHPWWVEAGMDAALAQAEAFVRLAADAREIGEVGLDFSPRRAGTREEQLAVFTRVCAAVADGSTVSLHAVHAEDELLDMLEESGLPGRCRCILHSFGGTHQQLLRALALGCWFSAGPRMTGSKKGRAYLKTIPVERLLLETDAPPSAEAAADWPAVRFLSTLTSL